MSAETTNAKPIPALVRFKFALVRGLLWSVLRCSSLDGLYRLGQSFGWCEWAVNFKRRRRFHRRMRDVFGDQYEHSAMRATCRRHFVRTRCEKFYYLIFDLLPREQILQRVVFPNHDALERSLGRGKGVYIALSHHGPQHVAGLLMQLLGYQVAGVRDRHEGHLRRYIQGKYAQSFSEVRTARIFYADSFPRDLYRWYQQNRILGSALDVDRERDAHLKRQAVTLFGETRQYLTGTLQIALRCQAAIHQGFIISHPGIRFELMMTPPLCDPNRGADSPEDLHHILQEYADNIEAHVRRHPDHISRI